MTFVVCVGEPMLELSRTREAWAMSCAGDAFNTAVHLARKQLRVGFLTAIGGDSFSEMIASALMAEGIDCRTVLRHPTRGPGLYAITTDSNGERSFAYWREHSAAREMFDLPAIDEIYGVAAQADLLFFSLISLAILPDHGRDRLLSLAREVRSRGGKVAFDGNYRPKLWASSEQAMLWADRAIGVADFGFPTLDDEHALRDIADPHQVVAHWVARGCGETVVKLGGQGCMLGSGAIVRPQVMLKPVDTSGAGDAFNAGYLAARLGGGAEADAAIAGHALAGWTIMRPGAVPPKD